MSHSSSHTRATVAVAAGRPDRVPGNPLSQPPEFASVRHAPTPSEYGRYTNTSYDAVEAAIGALEGGTAVVFASGMAAISALVEVAVRGRPGLVQPLDGYHGTRALLDATTGLLTDSVDVANTEAFLDALPIGGVAWVESPTNPLITVADLGALADGVAAKTSSPKTVAKNPRSISFILKPDFFLFRAARHRDGPRHAVDERAHLAVPGVAAPAPFRFRRIVFFGQAAQA